MKNVLMLKFPYSSTFGGGEIHTIGLIEGLMSRGFTFYYAGSCSVLLEQFKKRNWHTNKKYLGKEPVSLWGIVVFTLLSPLLFFYLAGILAYYRFAKNIRTVYCLSLGEKILGTPVIRLLGMKPVWVEHLLIERWLFQNPYRLFYVLWSNIASIVAVSGAVKRGLVELGVRESRTQVIYNSVDYDHFVPRVPPTETTIGYLGRFAPEKGLEDIVNAFGLAAKKKPGTQARNVRTRTKLGRYSRPDQKTRLRQPRDSPQMDRRSTRSIQAILRCHYASIPQGFVWHCHS